MKWNNKDIIVNKKEVENFFFFTEDIFNWLDNSFLAIKSNECCLVKVQKFKSSKVQKFKSSKV